MYKSKALVENLKPYIRELGSLLSSQYKPNQINNGKLTAEKINIDNYINRLGSMGPTEPLSAAHIIKGMRLAEHPEGGFYREFISTEKYSLIFYLVVKESASKWHSLSDTEETQKLLAGDMAFIPRIHPNGEWKREEQLTFENDVVLKRSNPKEFGDWFGFYTKGDFSLMTCRCEPPFEFGKFKMPEICDIKKFLEKNPPHQEIIMNLAPSSYFYKADVGDEQKLLNAAVAA